MSSGVVSVAGLILLWKISPNFLDSKPESLAI